MFYRAKTIKEGKWVHGHYVRLEDCEKGRESHRIYSGYAESEPDTSDSYEFFADWHEIDKDTLGRSTGKCDSLGEPIYEGDVVRITRFAMHALGGHIDGQTITQDCIVYWDDELAAFRYWVKVDCGSIRGFLVFKDERAERVEVKIIGNVFDLPDFRDGYEQAVSSSAQSGKE